MAGPYDYTINIPQPPAQNFLQSLTGIMQLRQMQDQAAIQQQQAAIAQQNAAFQQQMQPLQLEAERARIGQIGQATATSAEALRQGKITFEQTQQDRVRQMEQQAVAQAKQRELIGNLTALPPNAPMSDIVPIANQLLLLPGGEKVVKQAMENFDALQQEYQKASKTALVTAATQLQAGNIEGAKKTYSTFEKAVRNSGGKNPQLIQLADGIKAQKMLLELPDDRGVNGAKLSAIQMLSIIDPKAAESIVGVEETQAKIKKTEAETRKEEVAREGMLLDNRIKQYEADTGMSLKDIAKNKEERFKAEAAERAHIESQQFIRKYIDSRTAFEMMKEAPQNASGDEILLTQFTKMGDAGSVVSVTEKAGTRTVTLNDYVTSLRAKLQNDGSLGDVKRKELKDAAFRMLQAPQKQYKEYQDNLEPIYRERGLNPKNIFVLPSSEQILEDAKKQAAGPTGAPAIPISTGNIPVTPAGGVFTIDGIDVKVVPRSK